MSPGPRMTMMALSLLLGISCVAGGPAVGVAGPVQDFTVERGRNLTSYVRVYNEGNWTGSYRVSVEGNVSQITVLGSSFFTLASGENRKVSLTYVAPPEGEYYQGSLSISLEGSQIIPGVTREIRIVIGEPVTNSPPDVRIVFPEEGEVVSGVVDVVVEADDRDGDAVSVSIYVDDEAVSNSSSWVWRTGEWEDGEHVIRAVASDSNLSSEHNVTVVIENPSRSWVMYIVIVAVLGALALTAVVMWKRQLTA